MTIATTPATAPLDPYESEFKLDSPTTLVVRNFIKRNFEKIRTDGVTIWDLLAEFSVDEKTPAREYNRAEAPLRAVLTLLRREFATRYNSVVSVRPMTSKERRKACATLRDTLGKGDGIAYLASEGGRHLARFYIPSGKGIEAHILKTLGTQFLTLKRTVMTAIRADVELPTGNAPKSLQDSLNATEKRYLKDDFSKKT